MAAQPQTSRQPDHPVDPIFVARWSSRAFEPVPIAETELLTLLEAARWAPSSYNIQPWRFVYALRGDAAFDALAASLMPVNQAWAPQAAALIAVASYTLYTPPAGGALAANVPHAFDSGAAWASLALQASLSGWVTHAMGGFERPAAAAAVRLPPDHVIHAIVAVGKRGDPAGLPEPLRSREAPNSRKPLAETAFRGGFPLA